MYHVYSELDEEDDRTPVLSRENSDVKTLFPNRYQWKSHLLNSMIGKPGSDICNYNELESPDLSTADVRVLRLQSDVYSPCDSPNYSINSNTKNQFCDSVLKNSSATKLIPNVVSNVDELRVSDFIIRSNSDLKKSDNKYESIDELYTPIATSEDSSRKPSIVSNKSDSRQTNRRKLSNTSTDSQNTTPNLRRTTLITKSETLGLTSNTISNTKKLLIDSSTDQTKLNNHLIPNQLKNDIINDETLNSLETAKLKSTNSSSVNAYIATAKVQQHQYNITQKDFNIKNEFKLNTKTNSSSNSVKYLSTNNNAVNYTNNLAYNVESNENIINKTKIVRQKSDQRINTTKQNTTFAASIISSENITNTINLHQKNIGTTDSLTALRLFSSSQKPNHYRPWRPPKRTAEEIILDKNLEVNWSVSSIRSVFQNKKDDKPAAIDTVYAKFDAIPKTSINNFKN